MAKKNINGLWKIVIAIFGIAGTLISVGVIYATLNKDVETNCREIVAIKPEVKLNTEHRIQDQVDTEYIKEKISNIETVQKQILEEVRK